MVAFLPDAKQLRQDLRDLSESDDLTWIDVTAPGDGCSFALCDPVAVCGVARDAQKWPLVLSAAFTQTLSASKWKAVRWRFFGFISSISALLIMLRPMIIFKSPLDQKHWRRDLRGVLRQNPVS